MEAEKLFDHRLITRNDQAAGVAARVGNLQDFEIAHEVVIVDPLVMQLLDLVKRNVRIKTENSILNRRQIVTYPQNVNVLPHVPQRGDELILHPPVGLFQNLRTYLFGRNVSVIDKRQDAQFSVSGQGASSRVGDSSMVRCEIYFTDRSPALFYTMSHAP